MTITRKYYEALIDCFSRLASVDKFHPKEYLEIKLELNNLINRIIKFNLIPLTFSKDFFALLELESTENFDTNKISLLNELHFELIECLWTDRLRYGGELIQYVSKIKLALLNLNISELRQFESTKKQPAHYYFHEKFEFNNEEEKKLRIMELNSAISKAPQKMKVKINKKQYLALEEKLIDQISKYRNYILENYPTQVDNFTFSNKLILAYITEAMPADIYEFRIHSYISTSGDTSIKLRQDYYDFYPAYFHNLEETTDKFSGAYVLSLKKDDFTFGTPFSISGVHRELTQLFIQNSNENDIQEFAEFLLKCGGHKINKVDSATYKQFDIIASKANKKFSFEIFHRKSRSIFKIKNRIKSIKTISNDYLPCFIFTSFPGDEIYKTLKKEEIKTIILQDLIREFFEVDNSQILHWYIKSKLSSINIRSNSSEIKFQGDNLISRLEKCPTGETSWSEYESIGIDIFSFLFRDNFKTYLSEEQIENNLKNHRRDLLVNNNYSDSTSFWADVKQNYSCNAIIVDFKNYSKKLNSSTFFSVAKYTKKNVGNFAIIFSRKGLDETAKIEKSELFSNGKLLIDFTDNELIEMIQEKVIGKNPIDRLESKKFELVKKN